MRNTENALLVTIRTPVVLPRKLRPAECRDSFLRRDDESGIVGNLPTLVNKSKIIVVFANCAGKACALSLDVAK